MKTMTYNPSPLEVEFANIIEGLSGEIEKKLNGNKIVAVDKNNVVDNPLVRLTLQDQDGDKHMVIIKIIQKPDSMV